VAQHQIKKPVKDVPRTDTGKMALQLKESETGRYLLQVDRQTKGSFATSEAARAAGLEIKGGFPVLQVSICDSVTKSYTRVNLFEKEFAASGEVKAEPRQ
jgi:hypothetical protein